MLRRIAGGGMGEVYLAAASGPAGFVKLAVVKRILPHFAQDPEFVAMFVNEARLAATLDHPNIVRVYDFGEASGNFFYAMEYLHGDSLAGLLPALARGKRRIALADALTIGLGISAGLHFAHERRAADGTPLEIVHRDVSPANVFVTTEGEVKLLDFGIAKVLSTSSVTRDGTRKGKVPYMSPEQCIGAPLDRRSDVFALGILLYEMTTMTRLFKADNEFATMNMITSGVVPPPSSRAPDYPPALAAVVLRALGRDREQRHSTALELHEELERVAAELGLRTSPLSLGRFVRTLVDRPYPPSEAPERADEPQTAVFFAALNDALTARDGGAPALAMAEQEARREGPSVRSGAARVETLESYSQVTRSRAPLVVALAAGGALALGVAWQSLAGPTSRPTREVDPVTGPVAPGQPAAGAGEAIAEPAVVVDAREEAPVRPVPGAGEASVEPAVGVDAKEASTVEQPTREAPAVVGAAPRDASPRPASRPARKKPEKKVNVLDSLRPSK